MAKIAILYCKKVKDYSCIACAKCYKAMREKSAEFERYDDVELVAMTDCGDCPGVVVPRVKLLNEVLSRFDEKIEVIHFGTCAKLAMETAACPIDFEATKALLENKFGVKVVLGTHAY
ncbi:MAG: CGGC domain-containing protein [Acidobacteriota bacterium]